MTDFRTLSLADIASLASAILVKRGFSVEQAAAIADTVTAAERDGCLSHGLFRIPFYVAALKNARADPRAVPTLQVSDSSVVHVDAHGGFCPLALQVGVPALQEKARQHGIAALALHDTYNIAALWPEVEDLANAGLVAFAFTASNAYVAPAGGSRPVYGTNPMAFGFPRKGEQPLVFDQASSASARGEIQLHLREGKPLPAGWAIDRNGEPTTDPVTALEGAQLCFGGHKGASLALMVELLAGALIGDAFSMESSALDTHGVGAPFGGELVLAIDPSHCNRSTDHLARAEYLFREVLEQPGTRLPSQRRYTCRLRHQSDGVKVPMSLLSELSELENNSVGS
ncbi:MAG: Ldh family oxidoreductase [Granulosicoccus sp.]|nr:Ldh family oxidoreductase [Granulosicoccus sp.]